jgi:hypothetical protein
LPRRGYRIMTETSLQVIDAEFTEIRPVQTVEQFEKGLTEFREFTKRNFRETIDFGQIPGTNKPTLLKPGAEKVMRWYGLVVDIAILPTSRTDITEGVLDVDLLGTVRHARTGTKLGTVHANANSEEARYRNARVPVWRCTKDGCRWRGGAQVSKCPACGSEVWVQQPTQTLADQKNTILKMGDKRIWVAAALLYTGASEAYTQDVEDMDVPAHPQAAAAAENLTDADLCSTHKVPWRFKEGTGIKGPYAFWGCPAKNQDGSWCKQKPPQGYAGPKEPAASEESPQTEPANEEGGAPNRGQLLTLMEKEVKRLAALTGQKVPEEKVTRMAEWISTEGVDTLAKGPTELDDTQLSAFVDYLKRCEG